MHKSITGAELRWTIEIDTCARRTSTITPSSTHSARIMFNWCLVIAGTAQRWGAHERVQYRPAMVHGKGSGTTRGKRKWRWREAGPAARREACLGGRREEQG